MSYLGSKKIRENFMTICPRKSVYGEYTLEEPIPLSVIMSDGVDMVPDVKITVNDLTSGQKRFINSSGKGDKFKIKVIIEKNAKFKGKITSVSPSFIEVLKENGRDPYGGKSYFINENLSVTEALDFWIKNMTILTVTTRAIDVPNGSYVITNNNTRKQTYENYTVWELEFTKYSGGYPIKVNWDNTYTNKAIAAYNKKKKQNKKNTTDKAKKSSSSNNTFSKCKLSSLVYSKTQKKVDCVVKLQKKLKKKGYYKSTVDGWFYTKTKDAVKAFQKDYNKQQKKTKTVVTNSSTIVGTSNKKNLITLLPENGKVDKDTFNALCKV